ncbi:major tail protein [Clostridium sp. WILCCON 0269]|uniref:Major tail protein n=1 Tax=Candidatus Clostridium eludens TaxID=3381663 RepID=A0ABW8SPB2_9CLOT
MPLMGIEKLYVAKQLADTSAGMTFTTPQYYKNVQELSIKPKTNNTKAYAENRLVDQATQFDSADISMSRFSMSSAERAFLLGQSLASTGGSISADSDNPPFITLLYKAPIKVDGVLGHRYGVIYKVMFEPPDEDLKSLQGKPDLSEVPKLAGTAQPTEWSFADGNNTKHPWEYHIDTTDPNCPENIDSTWFNSVPIPSLTAINALLLSSSTPANNATAIALGAKPTLTFNNGVSDYSNILLMNITDGVLVANTMSLDTAGKVLTITPTTNLTAAKTYEIIVQGVKDIYGQSLATTLVKFTTASS